MRHFICATFASFIVLGAVPPANAQFGGILEEILGQIPQSAEQTQIDNIPVKLQVLQTEANSLDVTGHTLIVTAYAPAAPSGSFKRPDTLGQSQLLLTGLTFPLNLTVAAPAPVTETLEFARIDAKIVNPNGNPVWTARQDGFYKGQDPVVVEMVRSSRPGTSPQQAAQTVLSLETIEGAVNLSKKSDMFLGSVLTVQLIENGLAGGLSTTIAAETIVDLNQKKAPFKFTLERAIYDQMDDKSFGLKAWITDWAGRKTHVMARTVPYNGADITYNLTLDAYEMRPVPLTDMQANPSQTIVSGVARFDAYKGLPPGCRLTATLTRSVGANRSPLATRTILLDGLSGDVDFDLVTSSTHFDPLIPAPKLNVRITDAQGRPFFSAENVPAREGTNIIQLRPNAAY